jgi:hypothetical protein
LAPNDFWLFQTTKSASKGRRYHDIEDIQNIVMMALKAIPQQGSKNVFISGYIVGLSA